MLISSLDFERVLRRLEIRKRIKNVKIGTVENSQRLKKYHLEKLLKIEISESFSRECNSQWGWDGAWDFIFFNSISGCCVTGLSPVMTAL